MEMKPVPTGCPGVRLVDEQGVGAVIVRSMGVLLANSILCKVGRKIPSIVEKDHRFLFLPRQWS